MDSVNETIDLLQRVADKDRDALGEFYRHYHQQVYAFALSRLNDPHACADIVNEVMMAVWKSAERYQGKAKVRTWLLGIAHNKIVDRLRSNKRNEYEELDADLMEQNDEEFSDVVERAEDAKAVRHCIEKLSDAHRQVVHLAFFEDFSYGEIAVTVGCPEGTVKTRMFHAKQALKNCLGRLRTGAV